MVIAVCSFADRACDAGGAQGRRRHRLGRPDAAAGRSRPRCSLGRRAAVGRPAARSTAAVARRFGELVAAAAAPIDDVRGTAAYRRHALSVHGPPHPDLGLERLPEQRAAGTDMRVTFTVNGRRAEADDVWEGESLLYVLRERRRPAGLEERLRAGRMRVLHGLPRRHPGVLLPGRGRSGAGPRGPHRRGTRPAGRASWTRSSRPSSRPAPCSAASAPRACVVQAHALIERTPNPSDPEIREALAGNLCRCTGYEKILDAVRAARPRTKAEEASVA